MDLGNKLRQARLEAGLSQRQLCGEQISRNMLSQIENGSARPSMKTLQYLAGRLGKSVSYFLEESAVSSPNHALMDTLRQLHDQGHWAEAAQVTEAYVAPDPLYDREADLIRCLVLLSLAEQALDEGRSRYAAELLKKADTPVAYCQDQLARRRLLLLGRLPGQTVSHQLPSLDQELLLRAREALRQNDLPRAARLLAAVETQNTPAWHLLQGEVCFQEKQYAQAAGHFLLTHDVRASAPRLEQCYKELGDFRKAYEYACMQK